ncbi:GA-like domain-containing protein [Escherichia coli]|uniref:GA-like domain-containing protein n=5 Tax=Escherichia coli TaxID=562 RepID=UPI00203FFE5A|nr:hypothetical protein [Escherichia coli]
MKMIFTGKVSGEKTVLAAGARHTVKAQAGEQYGLVDEVTGLVPDGVEADRTGDDLILRKKEDDTEIRIEGFWEKCQPGETQCTAVFNVVGENGQVTEAVLTQDGPVLENFTAGQSGTLAEGISNGIIWGGIAFGAGLAAIALLAGGGGGSSRHKSAAGEGQNQVQAEGSQETGKIDGPPTVSTKPVNGNSFGQVPEVNDQDGNGRADDLDVAAATAAVEAAEAADQAAKDKLAELNADNLITPEEKAQLEAAKQNADTLKEEANSAVQALPDTVAEKGDLQDRVDALDGIQVPEVNDQDGNGRADDLDVAAATAAVEAAEAADQAAKDKLAELNADNLITPEEKAQLEAAKQNADTLKEEANSAVQALPDTVAEKGDLQDRVDALDGIQVPEVNDQDGNGRADDLDVAAATAAVEAAEAADQAAKDKLAELNADNLITPEEKAQLEAAKQNADTLKEEANSAVQALPDTVAEKGDLQDRVDALDGIQVPEVNDQDGNGRADDLDVAAATAAVEAAEAADQAAKDKLAELNADNLITPEEKAQLEAAKQNADTLKEEANSAVQALPDTVAEKGDLQDRVDALDGIQVPEVNDQDGNGIPDFIDSQLAFFNKASSPNVSGDLYPNAPRFSWSTESNKISTVNKNWEGILNANPGAYVTREVISTNVEQYNYNGINGSDIISIKNSLFGLDRTQVNRQPVGLFTGEGNDIIVTGQDYGRNTSLGYTDHANITNMGGGDDTLVVGAGNNNVTLYVNDDGQLRATTDGYDGLYSINYNQINPGVTGGTISGTDISMGEGNDTILALGTEGNTADAIINTNIDLGQGNDFIYINGNVSSAWNTSVNIRGNEGVDTLFIDNGNISSLQFSGFEVIKLGRNGGVNIREVDLLKSGADAIEGGDLKIIREASSRVKLEGDFIQKGIETVEGVNYLVYSNDNTPGIRILVDTDIPLIM